LKLIPSVPHFFAHAISGHCLFFCFQIIPILDIFCQGSTLNLVFPLLPVNLNILIYEYNLTNCQQARYAHMLLEGISYCHENNIIHRDLKPANLLIDWNGLLKICDFGQARTLDQLNDDDDNEPLSHQVCTRWYRSPELLYGAIRYDFSVDMWSVGCILAEMLQKQPLFEGHSDIEQLCLVVKQLGQPPASWANIMPDYNKLQISFDQEMDIKYKWDYVLAERSNNLVGVDLVKSVIRYEERHSAKQLLTHKFMSGLKFNQDELIKASVIKQMVGPPKQKKLN